MLLSLDEAKTFLFSTGRFAELPEIDPIPEGDFPFPEPIAFPTSSTLPDDATLAFYLQIVEEKLSGWGLNGQKIGVTTYAHRRQANGNGVISLPFYPVVAVDKIEIISLSSPQNPQQTREVRGYWQGGINVCWLCPNRVHQITYRAGYDSNDERFLNYVKGAKLLLLKAVDDRSIDFLHGINKEVASTTLAGLTQTFRIFGVEGEKGNWIEAIAGSQVKKRSIVW